MPNFKLFFNKDSDTLDVILHGGGVNMDAPFMVKVADACRKMGHSVVAFNFPYMDRGEEQSSGPELLEEIAALKEVLDFANEKGYRHVRFIGKSLGGIVASYFLKESPANNYAIVILGYVLGDIDLKSFTGKITIIQGENDRFGNIAAVKKDMETATSKDILFIEIPGANHSYCDPETKEPKFEDLAVSSIPVN